MTIAGGIPITVVAPIPERDAVIKAAAENVHHAQATAELARVLTRHPPAHRQHLQNLSMPSLYTAPLIPAGSRGKERLHARKQWQ